MVRGMKIGFRMACTLYKGNPQRSLSGLTYWYSTRNDWFQMTPAARLQMAIEILEALEQTAQPADRFLKSWFRSRRFAGSKDRRAIAERVFAIQRHRAHLAHRMGSDDAARAGDRGAAGGGRRYSTPCSPAAMAPRR